MNKQIENKINNIQAQLDVLKDVLFPKSKNSWSRSG